MIVVVPIIGNLKIDGDRLIGYDGRDLNSHTPINFGKDIGDIILEQIVGYRYVGKKLNYGECFNSSHFVFKYQVYNKKTTVTSVYEAGLFHWKEWVSK